MNSCATCKHWSPPDWYAFNQEDRNEREHPHGRGWCNRITMIGDRARPVPKTDLAHVEDGSRYSAMLYTKPDFGCILWEQK